MLSCCGMETHGCGRLYRMRFVPSSACNIENKINSAGKPQRSIHTCAIIFIARQRSCGKVMFSQVCLVNGQEGGGGCPCDHYGLFRKSLNETGTTLLPPPRPLIELCDTLWKLSICEHLQFCVQY